MHSEKEASYASVREKKSDSRKITGRKAAVGNNVSHSKRRTKRKFEVNLFNRKFFWVEQQIWIRLTVSAAGLRTINKIGLNAAIKQAAEKGYLTSIKTVE